MPDPTRFCMTFECEGRKGRKPDPDEEGEPLFQLWKIWNKYTYETRDGELRYEVQYWETDTPGVSILL